MPAQHAFNHVNSMLTTRYHEWYLALAGLPQWGKEIDAQVQRYVQGVQDVVRANLEWRFVFPFILYSPLRLYRVAGLGAQFSCAEHPNNSSRKYLPRAFHAHSHSQQSTFHT